MARRKLPVPRVLKKALGPVINPVSKSARRLRFKIETSASQSATLSAWVTALDARMGIEARRLLAGQALHERTLNADARAADGARYTLRRNTHRLEKGLCMKPRRPVFALAYLPETIDALQVTAAHYRDQDQDSVQWSCDVLGLYFECSGPNPVVERERQRFSDITRLLSWQRGQAVPYRRPEPHDLPSYEQLVALAKRRRSVRWFEQRTVPRDLIDKALEVGIQAPSACNRQPFRFVILDDPARVQEVGKIPMGTVGFLQNIPTLIVVVGQLRAFHHPRDRHLIYIDSCLAVMGFELALETLGLSSCSINWPSIPEKERLMEKALNLDADESPILLIAVGYPAADGQVPFSQKRPLSELRTFNP